jgi:hypothetical protein
MNTIYVPSKGPQDWHALLAKPEKHWQPGKSALELAECWEASHGFPSEVESPLNQKFPGIRPLIMIPELKVSLPGGQRSSQNDIWVLARSGDSLISIAVEGKVDEPFDRPLKEWLADPSPGKQKRWLFLKEKLGLDEEPDGALMYQLFHRAVSAIIQAEEFRADCAVLVVHSFSQQASWFEQYAAFLRLFGVEALQGKLQSAVRSTPVPLHFLWATGTMKV